MTDHGKKQASYVRKVNAEVEDFARDLLEEIDRLLQQVAAAEGDKASLQGEVEHLRSKLEKREQEHGSLSEKLTTEQDAAAELHQRFNEAMSQSTNLMNLYVAGYQLHGTLDEESVIAAIEEIVVNIVGSEHFVIVEQTDGGDSYQALGGFGVDLEELRGITDTYGGIDKDKARDLGYEVLDGDAWIDQDVDILIPSALENQINADNVDRVSKRVKIVAEGANGPTTPEADAVFKQRNVVVIPDFLANAGGVTCSYFEQVQSNMNYFWDAGEVLGKLDQQMTSAYIAVSELAQHSGLYMRDAAYVLAIKRVVTACRDRGWV